MTLDGFWWPWLAQLLGQLPSLLTCTVGIVLGLLYLRAHRRPALLTLIGAGVMLLVTLLHTTLLNFLLVNRPSFDWSHAHLGTVLTVLGVISGVIKMIGLLLILVAVFLDRSGPRAASTPDPPPRG